MKLIKENINKQIISPYLISRNGLKNDIYYIIEDSVKEEPTIGLIQLHTNVPKSAYIEIFIFKDYRKQGYGTASLKLLSEQLSHSNTYKKLIALVDTKEVEPFLINSGFVENKEHIYDQYYYNKEIV